MDLEFFKNLLIKRQKEIEKILFNISNEINEISKCEVKDEGDFAIASMDSGRDFQVYLKYKEELEDIKIALEKIEKNTYGICEMCDEKIEKERLKIKPHAKYCIICRKIIEREKR